MVRDVDKADISIAISLLTLLATSVFWMRQNGLQSRITQIEQHRWREEEEAKRHARVIATIASGGRSPELVLSNHGPAEARSVGFTVAAANDENPPTVMDMEILPLAVIHPDSPMSFRILKSLGESDLMLVKATWTDDAGPQEKHFKLRVP
jgi:hypothetical protein